MNTSSQAVFSLYRTYIRQIRILPHSYLRQFFALKARNDVEKVLSFKAPSLRTRNMKTIWKAVKRIRKANQCDIQSFQHILDLAYGRKGKLKWELLEPLMYPNGPLPDTIIQGKESSRPPVFSPELTALLTSPHSRTTKPLSKSDIIRPRNLPACANPLSEDARMLGRFSMRREVNIRRRQFKTETRKVLPPLDGNSVIKDRTQFNLRNVENAVGELCRGPTETRREREDDIERVICRTPSISRHSSRWVRRRYRWLLSHSPSLVYGSNKLLDIQISSRSFSPYQKSAAYMPEVDATTVTWFLKPIVTRVGIRTSG